MSIIKYRNGEVRLVWRIIIAVVISVAIAFLLRFIPIFLSTALQAGRGMDRQAQQCSDELAAVVGELTLVLRDQFAMAAISPNDVTLEEEEDVAKWAYAIADAMLEARKA